MLDLTVPQIIAASKSPIQSSFLAVATATTKNGTSIGMDRLGQHGQGILPVLLSDKMD
jgi:hypothetical protein